MGSAVRDYYNAKAGQEHKRLDLPLCRVEFASTLRLIGKYFPTDGRVCDIGGATGRYTIELLRSGYSATLVDLSEEELQLAAAELRRSNLAADEIIDADARDLSMLPARSFDAALLMGPLYHILERDGRAQALRELRRILKPQGIAIVAYLNAWGIIKSSMGDSPKSYERLEWVRSMLSPQVVPAERVAPNFTECYLTIPPAALQELQDAGFEIVSYAGAESFAAGTRPLLEQLMVERPQAYENIVMVAAETCELEQFRDGTDHLHIVVRT